LFVHLLVGGFLAEFVPLGVQEAASTVLMPLVGILIGLCFAWGGNANALLQTHEVEQMSDAHPGGLEEYAYVYQSAILAILITLCAWGLAGLGVIDRAVPAECYPRSQFMVRIALYSLASVTLRECWHVVLGAQSLLIIRKKIRDASK
jgi:hypothetical protein